MYRILRRKRLFNLILIVVLLFATFGYVTSISTVYTSCESKLLLQTHFTHFDFLPLRNDGIGKCLKNSSNPRNILNFLFSSAIVESKINLCCPSLSHKNTLNIDIRKLSYSFMCSIINGSKYKSNCLVQMF